MLFEILGLIAFLLLIQWLTMRPFYWQGKGIPFSLPLPILGNSFGLFVDSFQGYWNKTYERFCNSGGFYGFHNFHRLSLMISDPKVLKEMFVVKSDHFTSRGIHTNPNYDYNAKNVFFLSGNEWKQTRSKITSLFSPSKLKLTTQFMAPNFVEYSEQFDAAALTKCSINVNELSLKLSTDLVVNTIFGIKPDSFVNPNSFFFALQEELFGYNFVLRILLGTVSPFLYDLFKVTTIPTKTTLKLKDFILGTLNQRKEGIGVRQDFIQRMLELLEMESALPDEIKFTEKDAVAQCMSMYLGGTETTGNSLSFLLLELALHQGIQNKLRDEITKALANTKDKKFSYDLLNQLTYTTMTINECLRKYPIIPVITRQCTKDINVEGINIEVGTGLVIPIMAIHWDPKYYPEPNKFDPERFADDSYKENFIFFPFGIGPRTCIGWKVAIIKMAYALCELLPKYRLLPCDKTKAQVKFTWKPSLNPKGGIWLNVEKI